MSPVQRVLQGMRPGIGYTDEGLAQITGMSRDVVRACLRELAKGELVLADGGGWKKCQRVKEWRTTQGDLFV